MNKTLKFFLFVSGVALFVYGISLIPLHSPMDEFPFEIRTQNHTNSYLIIGLGVMITFVSLIEIVKIKS